MARLAGTPDCCWAATAPESNYPSLTGPAQCDVAIVGAGIVGLTTALELCESGKSVIVLEGRQVGRQVTGRSTAKITTQHALVYRYLIDNAGFDVARAYAEANRMAVKYIRDRIETLGIACDYERKSAYAYACASGWMDAIEAEAEAARSLGFDARVLDRAPLPFTTSAALEFPDQGQFNPASYLFGLAAAVQALGGRIHEHSRATRFEHDGCWRIGTEAGEVSADEMVIATNMTVKTPVGYANRTQPRCHVAMAFRIHDPSVIDGMFIGVDEPTHSLRTGRDKAGPLLVALGPRFNTGQDGDIARRFVDLENWARQNLLVDEAVWRWCNEDYDTPDRMPYVGQPAPDKAPGLYVATGFNAWGISNGTAAGLSIATQITTGTPPWGKLYDPTRSAPEDFHQSGDTQSNVASLEAIAPGESGIITRGEEKIAVWCDDRGILHGLSAACTHKGCTVTWNNADRTWDCPCHGSIFEAGGEVIHGPAKERLMPRPL